MNAAVTYVSFKNAPVIVIPYVMARTNFYPLFPFLADFTGGRGQNIVYFLRFACDFRKINRYKRSAHNATENYVFRVNGRQAVATSSTGVP